MATKKLHEGPKSRGTIVPREEIRKIRQAQADLLRVPEEEEIGERLQRLGGAHLYRRQLAYVFGREPVSSKRQECDSLRELHEPIVQTARSLGQMMERLNILPGAIETPLLKQRLGAMQEVLGDDVVQAMSRSYLSIMGVTPDLLKPFKTKDPLRTLMAKTDGTSLDKSPLKSFLKEASALGHMSDTAEVMQETIKRLAETRYGRVVVPTLEDLPGAIRQKGWQVEGLDEEEGMNSNVPLRRVLISNLLVEFAEMIKAAECSPEALADKQIELFKNYLHYMGNGIGQNLALTQGVVKITPEDYTEARRIQLFLYLTLMCARGSEITAYLSRLLIK